LRADGFIIRAQATIRTDGFIVRAGFGKDLRAARANRVFRADEQRIRTENTVMVSPKHGMGVLSKIAGWARMCFSSVPNR